MMGYGNAFPSVAVIISMMDRAKDLRYSLPSLLSQEYPNYTVYIVDNCSRDDLDAVLDEMEHVRLKLLRCPRPLFFNFSRSRNIGARYTFSDLLFFLNGDNRFGHSGHLTEIIDNFLNGEYVDYYWYRKWRGFAGSDPETGRKHYPPLKISRCVSIKTRYRRVYCHSLGSPLLVEREVFQQIGGYNENLEDWGYEDTDLVARLEFAGFGRSEIHGIAQPEHPDYIRTLNFREKQKDKSWERNRLLSDEFIRRYGPVLRSHPYPGRCEWIEIDGSRYDGMLAPQQDWQMQIETLSGFWKPLLLAVSRLLNYVCSNERPRCAPTDEPFREERSNESSRFNRHNSE